MADTAELRLLHASLSDVYGALCSYRTRKWPAGISTDSVFALGEAAGMLAKAKALVGRDIDLAGCDGLDPRSVALANPEPARSA